MNPLGNWWFSVGIAVLFTGLGWIVTERIVAPRLGVWHGDSPAANERQAAQLTTAERRGLRAAGLVALGVAALFAALSLWPGFTPLYDEAAAPGQRLTPLFRGLTPGFLLLFLATGWAYGAVAGTIRSHRDVVAMMAKGLEGMVPYLVLVFFAAQFVAMFGWSNLGPITAIVGAEQLRAMHAPPALLLPMLTTMSAWLDFLIASGSAKWTAMAPVGAPMMMLLGISPEMTTAAYRVGDTVTNLISPLNPVLCDDADVLPALDSGLSPRLAACADAAPEHRVLPRGRRPDGHLGGPRNPGRTWRGSVVHTAHSGALNGPSRGEVTPFRPRGAERCRISNDQSARVFLPAPQSIGNTAPSRRNDPSRTAIPPL